MENEQQTKWNEDVEMLKKDDETYDVVAEN